LDLVYRYGDKVRFDTAAACRFLVEAAPPSNVDRSGTVHWQTEIQLTGSYLRTSSTAATSHPVDINTALPSSRAENAMIARRQGGKRVKDQAWTSADF